MKIVIEGEYRGWPVAVESDQIKSASDMREFVDLVSGLGVRPANYKDHAGLDAVGSPMPVSDAIAPICPVHKVAMRMSQYEPKGGGTGYYCSARGDDGKYCKQKAVVRDGHVKRM